MALKVLFKKYKEKIFRKTKEIDLYSDSLS